MFNRTAMSSVVAISLFIVISVVSVLGFQNWYSNFQTSQLTHIETSSKNNVFGNFDISGVINNKLYISYSLEDNLIIKDVKLNGKSCGISKVLQKGVNEIPLGMCPVGSTLYSDIVVITDSGIISEKHQLRDTSLTFTNIEYNVSVPAGTNVSVDICAGDDTTPGDWIDCLSDVSSGADISALNDNRYFQYTIYFDTDDSSNTPSFDDITIYYY